MSNTRNNYKQMSGGQNTYGANAAPTEAPVAPNEVTYEAPATPSGATYEEPVTPPRAAYGAPIPPPPVSYGAPTGPAYGGYPPAKASIASEPGFGLSIAAIACGISSIVFAFLGFGFILGVLGLIFGGVSRGQGCTNGMSITGIVCGSIGTTISLIFIIICLANL